MRSADVTTWTEMWHNPMFPLGQVLHGRAVDCQHLMAFVPNEETLSDRGSRALPSLVTPGSHLFVALECARPLAGSSRHSLGNIDEVLLCRGTQPSAERVVESGVRRLLLHIPDPRISARHARLWRDGQVWTLEDSGSTNGSRVNGAAVSSATLADRDLIELGHTFLTLRTSLPTPVNTLGDVTGSDLVQVPMAFVTLIPAMAAALETVLRVAKSMVSVLLLGETGTGKEVLARAIHESSGRPGPFVAVNCGALPSDLLEAQLFGHVKGAFSGATRDELGYVRAAHQGTLFLDEIGDLPLASQAALLRMLEEREVVPVGTTRPIPVDLRVVAATHAPIEELVERGSFRSDLLGRLAGFTFALPTLRDRMEEFGTLVARILPAVAPDHGSGVGLSVDAARAMLRHSWPRNVRELKQCLSSAVILSEQSKIELSHLPRAIASAAGSSTRPPAPSSHPQPPTPRASAAAPALRRSPEEEALLRELLARFEEHRGNVTQVAKSMGKARVQVQRWAKRFGIDPVAFR